MNKRSILALAAMGVFAALSPATVFAHPDDGYYSSSHDAEHDRLDDVHNDIHDQLDEEHTEAHAQGLTPWEHDQLHRDLDRQHYYADRDVRREHQQWHRYDRRRDSWQWNSRYYPRCYRYYGY